MKFSKPLLGCLITLAISQSAFASNGIPQVENSQITKDILQQIKVNGRNDKNQDTTKPATIAAIVYDHSSGAYFSDKMKKDTNGNLTYNNEWSKDSTVQGQNNVNYGSRDVIIGNSNQSQSATTAPMRNDVLIGESNIAGGWGGNIAVGKSNNALGNSISIGARNESKSGGIAIGKFVKASKGTIAFGTAKDNQLNVMNEVTGKLLIANLMQ